MGGHNSFFLDRSGHNIDEEDNKIIGYDYDFLEDPTNDSDDNIKDYLMKP